MPCLSPFFKVLISMFLRSTIFSLFALLFFTVGGCDSGNRQVEVDPAMDDAAQQKVYDDYDKQMAAESNNYQ
jgi:hypothetical protein